MTPTDIPLQQLRQTAAYAYTDVRQSSGSSSRGISAELDGDQGNEYAAELTADEGITVLERKLGLWSGMAIVVGSIIGSGIFSSPALILESVGSVGMSMMVWVIGAIVSLCGCAAYMELGTMLPRSGGEKEYLDVAFPKPRALLPFVFCLSIIAISFPSGLAADAVVTGVYFVYSASGKPASGHSEWTQRAIGLAVVVVCGLLHGLCSRTAIRIQNLLTVVKVLLLVLIVCVGTVGLANGLHSPRSNSFDSAFHGTSRNAHSYVSALFKVFFSYSGYTSLNYSIDELRNPVRNLPRAAMGGLVATTVLYILSNVAFFVVLSPEAIRGANTAVAGVFFTTAFSATWGQRIIPAFIGLAAFGNVLCATFSASRVIFEAAREGYLPFAQYLGSVNHRFQAPIYALAVSTILSAAFIVGPPPGEAYDFLIDIGGYPSWVFYGLSVVGLLIMRRTHKDLARPFRTWVSANVLTIATALFMCIVPFVKPEGAATSIPYWAAPLAATLFIAASIPMWYIQIVIRLGLDRSHYALKTQSLEGIK
ncbi:hypothetical protein IW146_003940 [Coemansia sp. RSA 922]|nr:hypothetical protein H4S03_004967 [Coemansia sp. S3946]KAJ2058123.1 hypothetical protein GGH13_007194 [Coemansia sp. S155-1]KAJ2113329.1 hypothetical protein IW146_003940 [Coemansia sp. RSA 922]